MSRLAQLSQVGASAILTLNLAFIQSQSAQAAEFSFTIDSSGYGSLSFEVSPLSGRGTEQISLSQLKNYAVGKSATLPSFSSDFSSNASNPAYNPRVGINDFYIPVFFTADSNTSINPIFTFNSGELVGIEADLGTSGNFSYSGGEFGIPGFNTGYTFTMSGNFSLLLDKSNYQLNLNAQSVSQSFEYVTIVDENGYPTGDYDIIRGEPMTSDRSYTSQEGLIAFVTLDPIPTAVPEPLTMLGVGTALGFGSFFKRELKRKQKSESS